MRITSPRLLALMLLPLFNLQCAVNVPPPDDGGPKPAATVRFDEWKSKADTLMPAPSRFEVRKAGNASAPELLFATVAYAEYPPREEWYETDAPTAVFSVNHYSVSLNGTFAVRPATEQEWKSAAKLLHSKRQIRGNDIKGPGSRPDTHTAEAVMYDGKSFAKSGKSWGRTAALVSPKGKWLAVFSHTSREPPPRPPALPSLGQAEAGNGDLFFDIYDVASGKRVLTTKTPFDNNAPSLLFGDAFWVEDQYLVAPLDIASESCLLAAMPTN